MIPSVLAKIADSTRARVAREQLAVPLAELRLLASAAPSPRDFGAAFAGPGHHILSEIKFASPSEGEIAPGLDPVKVAGEYLANGARALSILTEPEFFRGSLRYLAAVRARYGEARLLMKDFFLDEYQLLQARATGADAILLIVAMLDDAELARLHGQTTALGLTPLVEVHDEAELARAAKLGARLIGVNNRDLKTLKVSLETSVRLRPLAPRGATLITESGLNTAADLRRLAGLGFQGFLIGTSFMRTGTPGAALARLLAEAGSP